MTDPLDPPPRAVGEPAEKPTTAERAALEPEAGGPGASAAADGSASERDAEPAEGATPGGDAAPAPDSASDRAADAAPAGVPKPADERTVGVDADAGVEALEARDAAPEPGADSGPAEAGASEADDERVGVDTAADGGTEAPDSGDAAPEPGAASAGVPATAARQAADSSAEAPEAGDAASEPGAASGEAADVDAAPAENQVPAPERRDIRALLRDRRTLVLAAAAVVVVAVVATLGVTLSSEDDRPVPSGSMPTLGSQFARPPAGTSTSAPGGAATLPAFTGNPLWTVQLPTDDSHPGFAVTDSGYVLQDQKEVVGLDKAGKEVWRFTPPEVDYTTVRVTGAQVFVGYNNPDDDRWPQPQVIVSLSAATGAELWRETEASLWSVTTDTIYMSVCYGGQNDRIGDCMFSARNLADNSTRWKVPTYASSRMENDSRDMQAEPTPPFLLVGAYRTGADTYSLSSHDPATGVLLGRGFTGPNERVGSIDTAAARTLVTTDDDDDNPADGCIATLTGFSMSGDAKWQYTARTVKEEDGKRCGRQSRSRNNGRMGVTAPNGAPSILNVETGAIEWSAPPKGQAIAASDSTLLVAEAAADNAFEIVAYRVGDAKPAWRAPLTVEPHGSNVTITGTQVVVTGYNDAATGYDLATGKGWTYGSWVAQETSTWFAVCVEAVCKGYAIR